MRIESFNGRLRDECWNSHVFASIPEAQVMLGTWRDDYNRVRPHSSLADRTPSEVLDMWVDSREARESTEARKDRVETEIASRFVTISPY
jgi:transposase InsO family protein